MLLTKKTRRAAIFVFYDKDGIVDRYVEHLLHELKENTDNLAVICNGKISASGRGKLNQFADELYVRENNGLDAMAFREGLLHLFGWEELKNYDELLLVNDTFYGPFVPLAEILDEMGKRDVDFWGLTEHYESPGLAGLGKNGVYPDHLQTYFLAIRSYMLQSREFCEYWEKLSLDNDFFNVVGKHEVLFTEHFRNCGFVCDSYVSLQDLREENVPNINFYAFAPGTLTMERKFCVIKRKNFVLEHSDLLTHSGGEELRNALDYVEQHTNYDVSMIWENLLRLYDMAPLRQSLHLDFIISPDKDKPAFHPNVLVVLGCIHEELFGEMLRWQATVRDVADQMIITDTEEKRVALERQAVSGTKVMCVPYMDWWNCADGYEYVCYLHDAVPPFETNKVTGLSYRYIQKENLLSCNGYISKVIELFTKNKNLGILSIPTPIHSQFFGSVGNAWEPYLKECRALAGKLKLHRSSVVGQYQPLMTDCAAWYRVEALATLRGIETADPEVLCRILPLIAQAKGFYTGTIYSENYASLAISNLKYVTQKLVQPWQEKVSVSYLSELISIISVDPMTGAPLIGVRGALKIWMKKHLPAWMIRILRRLRLR